MHYINIFDIISNYESDYKKHNAPVSQLLRRKVCFELIEKVSTLFPYVMKILLYDSKARGDFAEESDIDLLFIMKSTITRWKKSQIYDTISELEIKYSVLASAVFISEAHFKTKKLFKNNPKRRFYLMVERVSKKETLIRAKDEIKRAEEELEASKILQDKGYYYQSIVSSYYAVYHAAKSLLLLKDVDLKTHEGVERMFGMYYFKTGELNIKIGKSVGRLRKMREEADYYPEIPFDLED